MMNEALEAVLFVLGALLLPVVIVFALQRKRIKARKSHERKKNKSKNHK